MTHIRAVAMLFLDDLFEMGGGYVLNFSDRTFAQFFAEELNLDIVDAVYAVHGGSKGKRLRYFLQTVDKPGRSHSQRPLGVSTGTAATLRSRHGGGGLGGDRRPLSRASHQGAYPSFGSNG
jgi:hypothetical protein